MRLDKPRLPVRLVEQAGELHSLLEALPGTDTVAIDAERASGFRYSQRAYLFQIAIRDVGIWLIDTAEDIDLSGLSLELNKKTWLLHAATQDLPCLAELNLKPSGIIDTELSARLAGCERVGLGSLSESLLELDLAKEHSAADWSKRPLPQEMIDYAALDVDVMFELWDAISALLREQEKLEWALQEFANLVGFSPKPALIEPWRHLPGMIKVKDISKLKIAAALHAKRDQLARDQDIAPGRLIPDRSIVAAALAAPTTRSELAKNPDFQGRASRSLLSTWWQAIQESQDLEISAEPLDKSNGIPNHKSWERRFPDAHKRLERLRPVVQKLASELNLPTENLLTPDYLRRVAFEPLDDIAGQLRSYGARPWQIGLVTGPILECLNQSESDPAA